MSQTLLTGPKTAARKSRPIAEIAEFLTIDIQQSPEWAQELLDKIEAIQVGTLPKWERNGNAFYLELSADGAAIEDVVDETSPIQTVSLDEFRAAVLAWRERIE